MTKKRLDVQAIRAIAVLSVLAHHIRPSFFPNGYLGVDVFFTLSGYLILPKILNVGRDQLAGQFSGTARRIVSFLARRYLRLVPAFSVFIIYNSAFFLILGRISDQKSNLTQSLYSLFGVGNLGAYALEPDYFNTQSNGVVHLWSLSVEEQFYFVIPLLLLVFSRRQFLAILIGTGLTSLVAFFFFFTPEGGSSFWISYYSPSLRFWEFVLGGLVGIFGIRICFRSKAWLMVLFSFTFAPLVGITPKIAVILCCCLTAFILQMAIPLDQTSKVVTAFTWTGDRSYSIYLYHLPLIYTLRTSYLTQSIQSSIRILLVFILCLLLGHLSYKYVELKFNKSTFVPNDFQGPFLLQALAVLMVAALFFTGILTNWRFTQSTRGLPSASETISPCQPNECFPLKETSFVLLGDSHGNLVSKKLSTGIPLIENPKLINMTRLGCELLLSNVLDSIKHESTTRFRECLEHNDSVLKLLKQSNNPIIISQRSTVYHPEGLAISDDSYHRAYFDSLKEYLNLPNKVYVIGPVPDWPRHLSAFGADVGIFQEPPRLEKSLGRSYFSESDSDDATGKELAQRLRQRHISAFDIFCSTTACSRYEGGEWLYIDESHLSASGVKFLVAAITQNRLLLD